MSKSTPAPLTIPGMPKKGEAAPVVASIEAAPPPLPVPAAGSGASACPDRRAGAPSFAPLLPG